MRISNKTLAALLAGILVLAAGLSLFLLGRKPTGTQVRVMVDAMPFGIYDLHEDQTVRIAPPDDSWHNTLVIRDGRAFIQEADCHNQICVHTPALSEEVTGLIVCLPHGVIVELTEGQ